MSWGTHAAASSTAPTPRGERTRPARFRSAPAEPARRPTTRPAHPRAQYPGWRPATCLRPGGLRALQRLAVDGDVDALVEERDPVLDLGRLALRLGIEPGDVRAVVRP